MPNLDYSYVNDMIIRIVSSKQQVDVYVMLVCVPINQLIDG